MAQSAFHDIYVYSLSMLACSHLTLARRTTCVLWSVNALYEGKDMFMWLPARFGNSICYQILPFVSDHKLGLIRSGESIGVLVISPMVSLIVVYVQKLRDLHVAVKASIISSSTVNCCSGSRVTGNWSSPLFWAPESLMKSRWRKALKNPLVSVYH